TFTDTTVADFGAGTQQTGTAIVQMVDGEVVLAPTVGAEFSGTTLPVGWSSLSWDPTGNLTVGGGSVTVDGARIGPDGGEANYGPGRSLEFVATFRAQALQHIGFVADFNFNAPWAIFSTQFTTTSLYARTSDGNDTLIPGNWLDSPHRYRIDWNTSNVVFWIDG